MDKKNLLDQVKYPADLRKFNKEELKPRLPGYYRFGDTRNACSDISKIQSALGWSPKFTVDQSIQEYKEYLNSQDNVEDLLNVLTSDFSPGAIGVSSAVTKFRS